MKYLVMIAVILALVLCVQRGCRGIGERWRERMDNFRERREERFEERRERWQDGRDGEKYFFRRRFRETD